MAVRHDNSPNALMAARRKEATKRGGKMTGRGAGITPRVRKAIEIYVFGMDDAGNLVTRQKEAAEAVGLTERGLREAMRKPGVMAFYRDQCVLFREMQRAPALGAMAEIMNDTALKANAAGQKVRLTAAERLAFDHPTNSIAVNVGVGFNVNGEKAGYVIDLSAHPDEHASAAPLTLEHADE